MLEETTKGYQHWCPMKKEDSTWFSRIKCNLVRSIDELKNVFETNSNAKYMAFDTETNGLNADVNSIVGFSFAFSDKEGWYVPIRHLIGNNVPAKEALELFYQMMLKVSMNFEYNMRFDTRMMEKEGFDMSKVKYYDVQVGVFLADTNWKKTGLKLAERRWLGWSADTFEETLGSESNFSYLDPEDCYPYACVPGDTLIQMNGSNKPIRDIKVGDLVETTEGLKEVEAVYNQGVHETIKVVLNDSRCFEATSNHLVAVKTVLGSRYVRVDELTEYSQFEYFDTPKEIIEKRPSKSWDKTSIQDMEACYYLLGYGLADGSLHGNRLSFHIQEKDIQILEDMNKRFKSNAKISHRKGKSPSGRIVDSVDLSYSSSILREFLGNHGLIENKTGRESYKNIPDEYYRDFLRGFYDGDGSSNGYNMCFVCCKSISKQISHDLERLLGVKPLYWYQKGDNIGDLTYGRNESVKIYQYLYGNCSLFLKRKKSKALKDKKTFIELESPKGEISLWSSVSEAARYADLEPSSLSAVKNGKRNHTRGWKCKQIKSIICSPYSRRGSVILIEKSRKQEVYDIRVKDVHHYILDSGVISHNCVDAVGTFAVCQKTLCYYKEAKIAGRVTNEILYPFMKCEDNRLYMDLDYLRKCETDTIEHLKTLEHEIISEVGYPFKINSNKQLGDALQSIGINTNYYTKGGQMKVDIASLETTNLKEPHPILEKLIDYSKTFKMYNSYISSLIKECEENDSRLRFNFKACQAPTLRMAAGSDAKNDYFAKINVMAIPKPHPKMWYVHEYNEGDEVPVGDQVILNWRFSLTDKSEWVTESTDPNLNMRCAFLPDPGHYIVGMDYAAQELRMQANLANVKVWVDTFNTGGDLHKNMAIAMWGEENYDKEKRKKAKVLNFGMLYGMSAYTLAERFHISLEEGQDIVNRYWKAVPEIQAYQKAMLRKAKKEGTTYNYYGGPRRVRYYLDSDDPKMRAFGQRTVGNNPIQSSCATMTQIAFLKVWQRLYSNPEWKDDCHFFSFIHDEILSSVKKERVLDFIKEKRQCMETKYPNMPVKFETSVAIGNKWGNMFEFKYTEDGGIVPDMEKVEE